MNHTLGQTIRFYREKEGLTQEELADIIHVTKGKLAHWENNETIPHPRMIARLTGALRIPDDEVSLLMDTFEDARMRKAQEKAELQAVIDEQNKEYERLMHKRKALNLLWMGAGGFIVGCFIVFLTGSYKDNPWYFMIIMGLLIAGIPFGWSVLTDKSEHTNDHYDPYNWHFNLIVKWFVLLLKFLGACLIGVFTFPVVLLYHAYKGCMPGSLFRKILCVIFALSVLFVGTLVFLIASASLS